MSFSDQAKKQMEAAVEHLKVELKSIRTGRANSSMLDNVMVEVYGSTMRLKDVASVTVPEARLLLITPFDPKTVSAIGKGIEKANLGFMPIVDANVVRIKIPPMDEALRKEMIKQAHKKREDAKVSIRNHRRDANDAARKKKSAGELAEDQLKRTEKEIQELTDKYCKLADELTDAKEKEVMTI